MGVARRAVALVAAVGVGGRAVAWVVPARVTRDLDLQIVEHLADVTDTVDPGRRRRLQRRVSTVIGVAAVIGVGRAVRVVAAGPYEWWR